MDYKVNVFFCIFKVSLFNENKLGINDEPTRTIEAKS